MLMADNLESTEPLDSVSGMAVLSSFRLNICCPPLPETHLDDAPVDFTI